MAQKDLELQKKLQLAQQGATTAPGFNRFQSLYNMFGVSPNTDTSEATYNELNKKIAAGLPLTEEENNLYNNYNLRGK